MAVIAQPFRPRLQSGRRSQQPFALGGARTLVVLAVLAAIMALTTLAQTGRVATKGFELVSIETRQVELRREADQMRLKLAQLQSLSRIEERARESLGMRPATPQQIRHLRVELAQPPAIGASR